MDGRRRAQSHQRVAAPKWPACSRHPTMPGGLPWHASLRSRRPHAANHPRWAWIEAQATSQRHIRASRRRPKRCAEKPRMRPGATCGGAPPEAPHARGRLDAGDSCAGFLMSPQAPTGAWQSRVVTSWRGVQSCHAEHSFLREEPKCYLRSLLRPPWAVRKTFMPML